MSGVRFRSWPALGSTAQLAVTDPAGLESAVAIAREEIEAIDRACSRFREDSELSRANDRAGSEAPAGPLLIEACQVAVRAAEVSGGLVDPMLGVPLERAGYDCDWELMGEREEKPAPGEPAAGEPTPGEPTPHPLLRARRRPAWRELRIDAKAGAVRVPAGTKLDLGATAKALAADRACRAVRARLGGGVLVGLGGDLALQGEPPEEGWKVLVTDDHRDPGASAERRSVTQSVTLAGGGLATSSTFVRRWSQAGRSMHHIIDPATELPARSRWRTVSVAAASCVDANIASTTALLMSERAPAWLEQLGLPARLVTHDGAVRSVACWPEQR